MSSKRIKVSVIVPMYNVENYIGDCLDSLAKQTLQDIEIIIVNDGCTDNSLEVVESYKDILQEKLIILNKENGGQSSARNLGFEFATGEYVGFVDADDFIERQMYEFMYKEAIVNKLDIIQCSYINWYDDNPKNNYPYRFIKSDSEVLKGKEYFEMDPAVGVCDKLFKREFLNKVNFKFIEGIYAEDALLVPQIFFWADRVKFVNKVFYYYRRVSGSTTNPVSIEKSLKLAKDKLFAASELNKFRKREDWKGNISRIIVPLIITPFLKRHIFNKTYRKKLLKYFKEKNCFTVILSNINMKVFYKMLIVLVHKINKEGKV